MVVEAKPFRSDAVPSLEIVAETDNVEASSTGQSAESFTTAAHQGASPSMKVQLRPVGSPSPVTLLFEYALKAWDNQRGDHCTYRYLPSREAGSHMEMLATVLVRLPNKQPLLVKDSQPRSSRVAAQNAVAQLALDKLSTEDSELAQELEMIRKEAAAVKPAYYSGNPSPDWQRRNHYHQNLYHARQAQYYPQYGYYPSAEEDEFTAAQDSMMYYPMMPPMMTPPIETSGVSPLMDEDPMMTPTLPFAPFGYGYTPMPYMPEMMYYSPQMMPPQVTVTEPSCSQQQGVQEPGSNNSSSATFAQFP